MSQTNNNILMTVLLLLICASIVYFYNENINSKIKKAETHLKWIDDGNQNPRLMQKVEGKWQLVPTEYLPNKIYYMNGRKK